MEYLHKFTSQADFDARYNTFNYSEPWVSVTTQNYINSFTAKLNVSNSTCTFTFDTFIEAVGFYVWQVTGGESWLKYIVTNTRNIVEDTVCECNVYKNKDSDYGYFWEFDDFGESNIKLTNVTITDQYSETRIDYNKGFQGVDMVVDFAQGDKYNDTENSACRIVYATKDIGISAENKSYNLYTYTFSESSSIGPNGTKELLKVRILNFYNSPDPIDVEVPLDWRSSDRVHWSEFVTLGEFSRFISFWVQTGQYAGYDSFSITIGD